MRTSLLLVVVSLSAVGLAGCVDSTDSGTDSDTTLGLPPDYSYEIYTLPAVYKEPIGLYEPTIDVGPEGNIYVSSHSTGVGENPSPSYVSHDDGATWESMALIFDQQPEPEEQGSAPLLSDEIFIVASEEGMAWGLDCCTIFGTKPTDDAQDTAIGTIPDEPEDPLVGLSPRDAVNFGLAVGGLVAPDSHMPLIGWCADGREVCYSNDNAMDHSQYALDANQDCVPYYGTDRPWLAYNNGKLLLVNNPGTSLDSLASGLSSGIVPDGGTGSIPVQLAIMDTPPATPIAQGAAAWGIDWNLCGSSGGFIPGIPDMREDHFFAVPQWVGYGDCKGSHYDVITGYADDVADLTQTTVFENLHAAPAEADSTPSEIGWYGQTSFDADGALYLGAMNNTVTDCIKEDRKSTITTTVGEQGGIHLAVSTDDGATFTETTFRFDSPVSAFYMDGNRHGEGFLLNWGQIDGNDTDWYIAHVFANADGTLRMENKMLVVDDGPEASRHVQGASLGPDGRAYMVFSYNAKNPGASNQAVAGDTPLRVAVQTSGPTMPVA